MYQRGARIADIDRRLSYTCRQHRRDQLAGKRRQSKAFGVGSGPTSLRDDGAKALHELSERTETALLMVPAGPHHDCMRHDIELWLWARQE
jgi:hypothetical protein